MRFHKWNLSRVNLWRCLKPQVLSIKTYNIQTLIEEVVTFILPTAIMHSVHIIMDHFNHKHDIQCDGNQLKQVFINVLKTQ